jgi:hypothetical protein
MNDYIKYNLEKKSKKLAGNWPYYECCGYKCVVCGNDISPATIAYFNYDITRVRCYSCQENNKFNN